MWCLFCKIILYVAWNFVCQLNLVESYNYLIFLISAFTFFFCLTSVFLLYTGSSIKDVVMAFSHDATWYRLFSFFPSLESYAYDSDSLNHMHETHSLSHDPWLREYVYIVPFCCCRGVLFVLFIANKENIYKTHQFSFLMSSHIQDLTMVHWPVCCTTEQQID